MKHRIATTALAALFAAGSLTTGVASAQSWRNNGGYDRNDERRDDRQGRRDDWREDRQDRREDRREARQDRREERREARRWSQRQHNGYYMNGRWNYGPPPAWAYDRNDYRPGYHQWRRGERLPSYYRSHYREVDWRRERLRQPPRGYHYVRDDRGEVLLVAIATGLILSILLSQ